MADRPRVRLSREERVDQIVRATVAVVASRGYSRATATAIATEAGVAKGLVWHYFEDATDLMRTTAIRTAERLRDQVAADLPLERPVPDVVRAALSAAASLARSHADDLRAVSEIVGGLRDDDGRSLLGADAYEPTYTLQEKLFRRGQAEGTVRDVDVRVLARTYQAGIDAMIQHLLDHPDADPQAYAATLADLLLTGIQRPLPR